MGKIFIKTVAIIIAILFSFGTVKAQYNPYNLQELDFIITKIKNNYPAYAEKYNSGYEKLLLDVKKNIAGSKDSVYNFQQLIRPVLFFKDLHVRIGSVHPLLLDSAFYIKKLQEIKSKIPNNKSKEGYWKTDLDDYIIYLQKSNGHKENLWEAVIVEANNKNIKPGSIKFYITKNKIDKYSITNYIGGNGNMTGLFSYFLSKDTLITDIFYKWTKIKDYHPNYLNQLKPVEEKVSLNIIDSNFIVVKVPKSSWATKTVVDSLVALNRPAIEKTPNLIIDIRNNTGGTWAVYRSLFPYIFTKPVIPGVGSYRCSEDFIDLLKADIEKGKKDSSLAHFLPREMELLDSMLQYKGGFYYSPPDTMKFDTSAIYPSAFPKKVIVLMNYKCASASEMFVQFCQQSKKAIIAGEKTWGAVDNVEIFSFNSPSGNTKLSIPRTRMLYGKNRTLDFIGIQPDVTIPSTEKDWYKYILNYLNKGNGPLPL